MTGQHEAGAGQRRSSRVTMADVADASGVSRATVSYVLNSAPNRQISDATRAVVLETAQRLGHVTHASARSLRLGRSNVVLALVREFTFGYVADNILAGLDEAMTSRGYVLLVHRYKEELRPLPDLWPLILPDVVVAMGGLSDPEVSLLRESSMKLVTGIGAPNNWQVGRMQVDYLHAKGHRRLGYAYPAEGSVQLIAKDRLAGARAACRRLGLQPPLVEVVDRSNIDTVGPALDSWMVPGADVTAVCAHNDEIAIMLSLEMSSRGQTVGKDLAVVGVDNIPLSRIGITTIAIDTDQVTQRIVERVVAQLEDRPPRASRAPVLRVISRESA